MSRPDESMPLPAAVDESTSAPHEEIPAHGMPAHEMPPMMTGVTEPMLMPAPPNAGPHEPPVPSGPYRIPDPPGAEPIMWRPMPAPARPKPLLGPAVSVFAVLLWAFVVAGQFTTSWVTGTPLPNAFALLFVALVTLTAWIANVRLSRIVMPPPSAAAHFGRAMGIGAVALALFSGVLLAATAAGSASSRNHDVLIGFTLVAISTAAAIVGKRLTSPTRLERSHRSRFVQVVAWIAGALLTLVAGADLASNG